MVIDKKKSVGNDQTMWLLVILACALFYIYTSHLLDITIIYGHHVSPYFVKIKYVADVLKLPNIVVFPNNDYSWVSNIFVWAFVKCFLQRGRFLLKRCRYDRRLDGSGVGHMPAMPYSLQAKGGMFDSKCIVEYLDVHNELQTALDNPNSAAAFAVTFLQFYFDEWWQCAGGYHQRWCNDKRHASKVIPKALLKDVPRCWFWFMKESDFAKTFVKRQTAKRRLRYHLSCDANADTLDASFHTVLLCLDRIYAKNVWMFGSRLTIADISLFSWLKSHSAFSLKADNDVRELAPNLYASWKRFDEDPERSLPPSHGECIEIVPELSALLDEAAETLVVYQQANARAFIENKNVREFNEVGMVSFTCTIKNKPFCGVVKSFQVKAWSRIQRAWFALDDRQRTRAFSTLYRKRLQRRAS
jgi:hypothetical protein